jgi:hypothetical protein
VRSVWAALPSRQKKTQLPVNQGHAPIHFSAYDSFKGTLADWYAMSNTGGHSSTLQINLRQLWLPKH